MAKTLRKRDNKNASGSQIPLESSIVKSILRWLNDQPGCYAEKTHGGQYGNAGKPDITGCIFGLRFEFEVKRPEIGKLTELQRVTLNKWKQSGAIAEVVTSLDEVKAIINEVTKREVV